MRGINKADNPIKTELYQQGFVQVSQVLNKQFSEKIRNNIQTKLKELMHFHGDTNNTYFSVINRWPLSELLDSSTHNNVINTVKASLTTVIDTDFELFEADVLYKSPLAFHPTPCHQDISYVWNRPYSFSTWIPLGDITTADSALQFLPNSHQDPILPAIDFWQPDFEDTMRTSSRWLNHAKTCTLQCGDSLLFSSKIWHASLAHNSPNERIAIVLRWGNEESLCEQVPRPLDVHFGMWNCGEYTYQLLRTGLLYCTGLSPDSLEDIIVQWQELLIKQELPFPYNHRAANTALTHLKWLHQAYQKYGGGDGQGIVYAKLWREFLFPLKTFLEKNS